MTELAGRYRLGDVIGTGGTATVYRATDVSLGVERAVKVLRVDPQGAEGPRARLRAEARAMARVAHPNILRVYDVGTDGTQDFVVMELAPGGSLQDRLDEEGPLAPLVACRFALQVLGALVAAHAAGVIHRDVKPQNVLLDSRGVALLADFGIALLADARESRHTRVGVAMGSMTYMPPEQRLDASGVTVAADVYAAGATLYALLTAASPIDLFLAAPGSVRWEDVPEPVRMVLQRATRLVPDERWGSAREMAAALLAAMDELPAEGEHPEDDRAWSGARDDVLATFALPGSDFTTEQRRPPPRRAPAGVDPTVAGEPPPSPEAPDRPWRALALGLAAAVLAGVWVWREQVAPGASVGVVRAPAVRSTPDAAAPPPGMPAPETAAPVVSPESTTRGTSSGASSGAPAPAAAPVAAVPASPSQGKPRTARVTPSPAAANAAVASPSARTATGRWRGAFDGKVAEMALSGGDGALRGEVTVRFLGNAVVNAVRGTFDPATGKLELDDTEDAPDSGRYTATLTDERALVGRHEARTGRVVSFRLVAVP